MLEKIVPSDLDRALQLLSATTVFSVLPPQVLSTLARGPRLTLDRGASLFSAGDPAEALYLILGGEIALEIDGADGKYICVSTLGVGGVFGELAVLDGKARSVSARAAVPSALLSIKAATYLSLVRAHPEFALAVLRELAEKLRRTNGQVSGLSFQSLRSRVASLVIFLGAAQPPGQPGITITQTELAARLGASREKVNGHLQALQAAGAVRLARGRIEIVNPQALRRFDDSSLT